VHVDVLEPGELGAGEVARWRQVQDSSTELDSPFLTPQFAVAVARVRPSTRVAVLSDASGVAGFFPYERRRWSTASALATGLSDVQALVVAPTTELNLRTVLRACGISVWGFDHLLGHQAGLIGTASARAVPEQSPAIDLRDGFEMYEQRQRRLSSSLFQSTARKRRKLERDHGPVRLLLHSPEPSHLAQVLRWKSSQYRRTGRRDRFADPATVSLVHELFECQEPTFSAPLTVLMAGDRLVAGHLGLRSGSTLAWWFPAYGPEFSAYSPGLILTLELARAMPAAGLSLLDLGKGDEPYKDRLQNLRIPLLRGSAATSEALARLTCARDWPKEQATKLVLESPRLRGWARESLNQVGALRERAERFRSSFGRGGRAGEGA
jgi:CelD/BcsL family acetyltransferase involved in cellulose biosynthesis